MAALLAALVVGILFAAEVGSPNDILHAPGSDYTDLLITHWPNAYFFQQSVWRDHCWPLWNPMSFSGTPFAANPLSGVWYPPNWIFLILPITPAFNLLLIAHLMLGAAGAARLVDRLRTGSAHSWVGPLVGGLAWGLAPKTWGSLGAGHVGVIYALGWLPWIIDAAVVQLRTAGQRIQYRLPVYWALQFVADPRIAAYTALMLAGLLGWSLTRRSPSAMSAPSRVSWARWLGSQLLLWMCIGILAVGLAAVQWVPLADLLPHTSRAELTLEESAVYSLPVGRLLGLLWPDRGGFHEWMTYSGIAVLWLAICGWLTRSRHVRWGTGIGCCLFIVLSLGTNGPLYSLAVHLPGASLLRVPPRLWFPVAASVAIMAGLGADELVAGHEQSVKRRRNLVRVTLVLTAFTAMLALGAWAFVEDSGVRRSALWSAVWLSVAAGVSLPKLAGRVGSSTLPVVLVLIVVVDLVWMDSSLVDRMSLETAFADDIEVAGRLGQDGRVYAPSFRPSAHLAVQAGLRVVNGVDPLQLSDYAKFLNAAAGVDGAGGYSVTLPPLIAGADAATALEYAELDARLLSVLDVRNVVSQFPVREPLMRPAPSEASTALRIYQNELAIPWPVVFQRVQVVSDLGSAIEAMIESEPSEGAVVSEGYPLYGRAGYSPATLRLMTPNRILIDATGPGLLVVSEVAHPGWRARVDGQTVEIYPTDGILRGVYLTAGDHTVEMSYRPGAIFWGLGVSIVSLAGLMVACRGSRRRA